MAEITFGHAQTHLSKAEARQQLLRILRSLPYGNSVFFTVTKIEDPIGLLPGRIILGINKRGVCGSAFIFVCFFTSINIFMTSCVVTLFPHMLFHDFDYRGV